MINYWKGLLYGIVGLELLAVLQAMPSFAAEVKTHAVGLGLEYATGDYGTDTTTDSWRIPLTIDYFPTDRVSFELIVPYIFKDSQDNYYSNGMYVPFSGRQGGMRSMGQNSTASGGSVNDSTSGVGDISLTASYLFQKEGKTKPGLRPLLYLKFPSGDEDKTLGTGEYSIGGGIGIFKWFGSWFTFAEGRYITQGSNENLGLKDFGTLEGEVGYLLTDKFFPSLSVWWSSAQADGASEPAEARLKGTYRIDETVHLEGFLGTGLSNTTADFGAGLAVFYSF